MTTRHTIGALLVVFTVIHAAPAQGQPASEIGASLAGSSIGLGNQDVFTLGIPSGGFGIITPGAYASFFLGTSAAVEPQIGFILASVEGESQHVLNLTGQFDYFISGTTVSSAYIFGAAGLVETSNSDYTPKSFGFGAGYRMPVGDSLAFRVDGRWVRYTAEFGDDADSLVFTFSIGGVF